jgi:hypothetical protein
MFMRPGIGPSILGNDAAYERYSTDELLA